MVYDDISLESFMHNYVGKNKPFKGRVAQLGKVQYVDLSGQYIQVLDDYGKVKPAFYDRVRLPQNLCHTFIPDNTRVSNRDMWLGQEPYKRDSIKSNKSNYDWGYARGATLDASSAIGDGLEWYRNSNIKSSIDSGFQKVTSKIIPAIIKFGKFSNWVSYGMLGRNFMKESITLRNLVDTAYITLIYVAGAAVGTASGAWIIAGVYLVVDVTVKVTTGKSMSEHTADAIDSFLDKASRETSMRLKEIEYNMWRFINMLRWP